MNLCCENNERREAVRLLQGWTGLDYVEVGADRVTLYAYFLGKLPRELAKKTPQIAGYLHLDGGHHVTGIQIVSVDPVSDPDPEKDDYLAVRVDKPGDLSAYTLRITGVDKMDPRYTSARFHFNIDCPLDLDCAAPCVCEPEQTVEPVIDYLAKDYDSFRQLILDRMALLVPEWKERHVPDIGIALVELLAYAGDYLSYHQDAVATEAYLDTARLRISVRRHTRLVDYRMHEGCNARAFVCLTVSSDFDLDLSKVSFVTAMNDAVWARGNYLTWDGIAPVPAASYDVFETLLPSGGSVHLSAARNEIHFYTWGDRDCCLPKGSIAATLVDTSPALDLKPGDLLILEEVLGAVTGLPADADPSRRQAVRLTKVTPGSDPVIKTADGANTAYVNVEWAAGDALKFPLCISAVGAAPLCPQLQNISVARGNVLLVDHGRTLHPEDLGTVGSGHTQAVCECAGEPGDVETIALRYNPRLSKTPLTFRQPLNTAIQTSAAALLVQDERSAMPQLWLSSNPEQAWESRLDLIECGPDDSCFVVEIDNQGLANIRFGNGDLGLQPPAGTSFAATYRVGNGRPGLVGAESISRLVLDNYKIDGVAITVRNPLAAAGAVDPEPLSEAKLFAPRAFRKVLERAIIPEDYEQIAERYPRVQNASAQLVFNGSWYEADVAIDPLGAENASPAMLASIEQYVEPFRRIGHDLAVVAARYVPLDIEFEVCALPHYLRAHVKAELLARFSNRRLTGGKLGFFHPDNLTFGEGIYLSQVIAAAQSITGVECVTITRFHRLFESSNQELQNGFLPLAVNEIAQCDNDPNFPEHGILSIAIRGGR